MRRAVYKWIEDGVEGLYHEGEEVIAKDREWACYYAMFHLVGRFRAGEEKIKEDAMQWEYYMNFLNRKGIEI